MYRRSLAISVGVFIILVVLSLVFLALRVSGLSGGGALFADKGYTLSANFDNIGNLKIRAPVRLAGVVVGQVDAITLNKESYQAHVAMKVEADINNIPTDSTVSITSMGLLGDNYVSISPGYDTKYMKNDSQFSVAYSATSLTSLISTFASGGKKK